MYLSHEKVSVFFPQRITKNILLKNQTNRALSAICGQCRLLWFGHVGREGREPASCQALELSINTTGIKVPRGRPLSPLQWVNMTRHDRMAADQIRGSSRRAGECSPGCSRQIITLLGIVYGCANSLTSSTNSY